MPTKVTTTRRRGGGGGGGNASGGGNFTKDTFTSLLLALVAIVFGVLPSSRSSTSRLSSSSSGGGVLLVDAVTGDCFVDKRELRKAVEDYMADDQNPASTVALKYGYPSEYKNDQNNAVALFRYLGLAFTHNAAFVSHNTCSHLYTILSIAVNDWCVDDITDMSYLFADLEGFDYDVSALLLVWLLSGILSPVASKCFLFVGDALPVDFPPVTLNRLRIGKCRKLPICPLCSTT